jgi:hypothetical protein
LIVIPSHNPDIPEAVLQSLVHARVNQLPGVKVWRFNVGAMRDPKSGRVYKFGVPGQADLGGLMEPNGRRLEIELKSRDGRQSTDQKLWQADVERYGGLYILARTLAEAMVPICEALQLPYRCTP